MNNILELCKIFKCNIGELVNDNMIDLDSLDEDVKMSIVKLKKEEQNKIKKISKIIEVLSKIGTIVSKVCIPFIVIIMIILPVLINGIEVKDDKLVGTGNIKIVEENNNSYIYYKNSRIGDFTSNDESLNVIISALKNNSKVELIVTTEAGIILLLVNVIVVIYILDNLRKLFSNINNGDTPFTMENADYIEKIAKLMIVAIIVSGLGEGLINSLVTNDFDMDINGIDIVQILFLFAMSYIFKYGYMIQQDSDGVMYGGTEDE